MLEALPLWSWMLPPPMQKMTFPVGLINQVNPGIKGGELLGEGTKNSRKGDEAHDGTRHRWIVEKSSGSRVFFRRKASAPLSAAALR